MLFDHRSVHKVVTTWWHDSTELGALLVTYLWGWWEEMYQVSKRLLYWGC